MDIKSALVPAALIYGLGISELVICPGDTVTVGITEPIALFITVRIYAVKYNRRLTVFVDKSVIQYIHIARSRITVSGDYNELYEADSVRNLIISGELYEIRRL